MHLPVTYAQLPKVNPNPDVDALQELFLKVGNLKKFTFKINGQKNALFNLRLQINLSVFALELIFKDKLDKFLLRH